MRALFLIVLLVGGIAAVAATNEPPAGERIAIPLPEFNFTALDGHSLTSSNRTGRALLIWFFVPDDKPCQRQLPILMDLQQNYAARGLDIIGMALDPNGPAAAKSFAATNHINFPIVMMDGQFIINCGGLTAVPTLLMAETTHNQLIDRFVGVTDRATIEGDLGAIYKQIH